MIFFPSELLFLILGTLKSLSLFLHIIHSPIAPVLNLWVSTPFEVKQPFHLRSSEKTDICISIHNSRKIMVMKQFYDWGSAQHAALGRLRITAT